jgi:hypothetical protein
MYRFVWLFFAITTLLSSANPPWKTPGVCLTPSSTLCRTLVYESSGWANQGWGFFRINRYRGLETEAVSQDGTAMLRSTGRDYDWYFSPSSVHDRARIVLPKQLRTVELEHDLKKRRELGGVWRFSESWSSAQDCAERASLAGKARRTFKDPMVAGVKSIEYLYRKWGPNKSLRIAFAPALGCIAVERSEWEWNGMGFPILQKHFRLVSAKPGEPEPALFAIPASYQLTPQGINWPYMNLDTFPGYFDYQGIADGIFGPLPSSLKAATAQSVSAPPSLRPHASSASDAEPKSPSPVPHPLPSQLKSSRR